MQMEKVWVLISIWTSLVPRLFINKLMAWQLTRVQTVDLATLPWSVQYQSDFRTLHLTLGEYHLHHNYITVCSVTIDVSRGTLVLGMTVLFKLLLMAAWCATTTVAGDKMVSLQARTCSRVYSSVVLTNLKSVGHSYQVSSSVSDDR